MEDFICGTKNWIKWIACPLILLIVPCSTEGSTQVCWCFALTGGVCSLPPMRVQASTLWQEFPRNFSCLVKLIGASQPFRGFLTLIDRCRNNWQSWSCWCLNHLRFSWTSTESCCKEDERLLNLFFLLQRSLSYPCYNLTVSRLFLLTKGFCWDEIQVGEGFAFHLSLQWSLEVWNLHHPDCVEKINRHGSRAAVPGARCERVIFAWMMATWCCGQLEDKAAVSPSLSSVSVWRSKGRPGQTSVMAWKGWSAQDDIWD